MCDPWLEVGLAVLADPRAAERRLWDGVRRAQQLADDDSFARDVLPQLEARQTGGIFRELVNPRTGGATRIAQASEARELSATASGQGPDADGIAGAAPVA